MVSNATLDAWSALHQKSLDALSDTEQEVDLERVNAKILKAVGDAVDEHHAHAHGIPSYNATEHGTEIDFLGDLVHKARLAPYRQELLELLDSWQSGESRISAPLNRIEELIDDEVRHARATPTASPIASHTASPIELHVY